MYFSRITLRRTAQASQNFWQAFQSPYALHKSIWGLYGDRNDRKRDFLYRLIQDGNLPKVFTVSKRRPTDKGGLWSIETKQYEPDLRKGMALSFMLRANPVRTKRDSNNRQHRHDVVMDAKTRFKLNGVAAGRRPPLASLLRDEGGKWLIDRSEKYGFTVDRDCLLADGHQALVFSKGKGSNPITISTIDFSGTLSVVDPGLLTLSLYQGVGPAKGFGCGMLMVKRV